MLVRCPQCGTEFRLRDYEAGQRVIRYLCPGCGDIVRLNLELDEIHSSSSSGSFRQLDRRPTVLVADDDARSLERAVALLAEEGYRVVTASDGVEAMQAIREEYPDVVVLDLLLPRMTGFDVLRAMRREERIRDTPVLAMSGVYQDNVVGFLQELGARGLIDKSRLADTLVFRVRQALPATDAGA